MKRVYIGVVTTSSEIYAVAAFSRQSTAAAWARAKAEEYTVGLCIYGQRVYADTLCVSRKTADEAIHFVYEAYRYYDMAASDEENGGVAYTAWYEDAKIANETANAVLYPW